MAFVARGQLVCRDQNGVASEVERRCWGGGGGERKNGDGLEPCELNLESVIKPALALTSPLFAPGCSCSLVGGISSFLPLRPPRSSLPLPASFPAFANGCLALVWPLRHPHAVTAEWRAGTSAGAILFTSLAPPTHTNICFFTGFYCFPSTEQRHRHPSRCFRLSRPHLLPTSSTTLYISPPGAPPRRTYLYSPTPRLSLACITRLPAPSRRKDPRATSPITTVSPCASTQLTMAFRP